MTGYTVVQALGFVLNLFVWTFILAQRKRDPVNRAFLLFAGAITLWAFLDLHMLFPVSERTAFNVMRLKSVCYLPAGWLLLRFISTLLRRQERDRVVSSVFFAVCVVAVAVGVSTPYLAADVVKVWWGWTEVNGPFQAQITIVAIVVPATYGLVLAGRTVMSRSASAYDRRVVSWVLIGGAAAVAIGTVADILVPFVLGSSTEVPLIASVATASVSFSVFIAVIKHNLMSVGIEGVANLAFANSTDATLAVDARDTVTVMNAAARALFGDAIGRDVSALVPGYASYASNETIDVQVSADRWHVIVKTPIIRDGVHLGETVALRDVTTHKRAEEALRESEEHFRDLFDNASDLIQSIDADGRFVYVNEAWRRALGYSGEDVARLTLADIVRPDLLPKCLDMMKRVAAGENLDGVEAVFRARDGTEVAVEGNVSARFKDGRFIATRAIFRDVTVRRQWEEQLSRERDFSTAVLETAEAFVLVLDPDGRIVRINAFAEHLTGYALAEVLGRDWFDVFVPPREQEHVRALFRAAVGGSSTRGNVSPILTRDRGERLIEWYDQRLTGVAGATVGLVAIGLDVTERIRAQKELAEAEERWRTIFNTVSDGILVADVATKKFAASNAAMCRMLGYSEAELKQLGVADIHPQESLLEVATVFERQRTGEQVAALALPVLRKDGGVFYADVNSSPLSLAGRHYLLGVFRDVTDRRRADEVEKESARRWQTTFDATSSGIMLIGRDHTVIQCNSAAAALLGLTPGEVIGRPCFQAVHHTTCPIESCPVERAFATGTRHSTVVEVGERNIEIVADPVLDDHSRITGAVHIMNDVTERTRLEREWRRARDAAEEASLVKSMFLANMSHEIRTPMNGIIGMTELVLDTNLTDEQRDYLQMVRSSGESLLTVINDVLDFSKIEAGKLRIARAEFDVRAALEDAFRPLALRAQQKGLEAVLHVAATVPQRLAGDAGRVRQMLVNMLGNAIKFTDRGEVSVRVSMLGEDAGEPTLHVAVRDTGPGIPAERLGDLFVPFMQLDGSSTRMHGGTGLGLAICSQLAELMGGRVWVESVVGQGSTFHFTARCGLAAGSGGDTLDEDDAGVRGLRTLVVDDNATNRRLLVTLLARWGACVDPVNSAAAAMDALRTGTSSNEPYRVVIVDGQMPGTDGYDLAKLIADDPSLCGLRRIMLTSSASDREQARCAQLGIHAFLTKPVRQSELRDALRAALAPDGDTSHAATGSPAVTTAASVRPQSCTRQLGILAAEDHPVNRALISRILEKRGYRVVTAANGREVVDRLASETYDVVLMDVEMPVMDGYGATAEIRRGEAGTGRHLPIVAMTAHAMDGDRERCLAAGMDGYVAKPVRAVELFAAIDAVVAHRTEAGPDEAGPARPLPQEQASGDGTRTHAEVLEREGLLDRCGGDESLVREVVGLLLSSIDTSVEAVRGAAAASDAERLEREAHSLRGALASVGAMAAVEAAEVLERSGHERDLHAAGAGVECLDREIERLTPRLRKLITECSP